MIRRTTLISLFAVLQTALHAHPVAQGALELRMGFSGISTTLRVSNEQVFIASTLGEGAQNASDFSSLISGHGRYLLRHFSVLADGVELRGEIADVQIPADQSTKGFTTYRLHYPLSVEPGKIELRQDLLTEILYAPGNPWEAPLIVRAWRGEQTILDGALLTATQPVAISLSPGANHSPARSLAGDFFYLGLLHIAGSWDHTLFVLALVLALPGAWRVVALVSVFTLAHTISLILSVLGLVHLRSSVVEPMVAASIVAAAVLNVLRPAVPQLRTRLAVAFGFGLFHGLGFAGGLVAAMEASTTGRMMTAIGSFTLGVEVGHQAIVIPLLGLLGLVHQRAPQAADRAVQVAGGVILTAGAWLFFCTVR